MSNSATGDFVDLAFGEVIVRFCGTYEPGSPDVHTLPNGDPGYPGSPSDFIWESAWIGELDVTDLVSELLDVDDDDLADRLVERYELEHDGGDDEPSSDEIDAYRERHGLDDGSVL